MPVGPAKFDVNRGNESPLRGEKPNFWPASKFNTGSLPLRGILPVITVQLTKYGAHYVDLCRSGAENFVEIRLQLF